MKLPALWITAAFASGIGLASRGQSSPTIWFACAAIGIVAGLILIWQERAAFAWCLALLACSGLPYVERFLGQTDAFVFVSILVLLWAERVPVPRVLQRPLLGIASATLFIYIVNYSVINRLMPHFGLPAWWPVQVGSAMVTGIVAKMAWDRVVGWVSSLAMRSTWRLPSFNMQWSRSFGRAAARVS